MFLRRKEIYEKKNIINGIYIKNDSFVKISFTDNRMSRTIIIFIFILFFIYFLRMNNHEWEAVTFSITLSHQAIQVF